MKHIPGHFLLAAVVALTFFSCTSKRKLATANGITSLDPVSINKVLSSNDISSDFFSGKASAKYIGNDQEQDITLNIRMEKDKKIWISATAILGIEVARILVTEDSIHILLHIPKREYIGRSLDFVSQYTSAKLTVGQLQGLLIGNSIFEFGRNTLVDKQADTLVAQLAVDNFIVREFIHPVQAKIARMVIQNQALSQQADVLYSEFQLLDNKNFPSKVNIFVNSSEINASFQLKYFDYSTAPVKDFPFKVPSSYTRK